MSMCIYICTCMHLCVSQTKNLDYLLSATTILTYKKIPKISPCGV